MSRFQNCAPQAAEEMDRSAMLKSGAWVAEEAACGVMDTVLRAGKELVAHRFFERKSFQHAADTAEKGMCSYVDMCFVKPEDQDNLGDYAVDREPEVLGRDAWAAFSIPTRRPESAPRRHAPGGLQGVPETTAVSGRRQPHAQQQVRSGDKSADAASDHSSQSGPRAGGKAKGAGALRSHAAAPKTPAAPLPRSYPLPDHRGAGQDEWEEKLRFEKAQKRQQRLKDLASERQREEDDREAHNKALRALESDAKQGACTYDSSGTVIWIEEPDVERLPRTHEVVQCTVDGQVLEDNRTKRSAGRQQSSSRGQKQNRRQTPAKTASRRRAVPKQQRKPDVIVFSDGFQRPDSWQPPIWETFSAKAGVSLECNGLMTQGPRNDVGEKGRMTRKEYQALISGDLPPPPRPASAPTSHNAGQDGRRGSDAQGDLSAEAKLKGGTDNMQGRGISTALDDELPERRREPAAPGWTLRATQSQGSLGSMRPPRFRVASLGGLRGVGPAQPVLGATMGHGLVAAQETFFFPGPQRPCSSPAARSPSSPASPTSAGGTAPSLPASPTSANAASPPAGAAGRALRRSSSGALDAAGKMRPASAASANHARVKL